ncbi:MAG TPA: plastocyanin/azurin family copper-binding protein [Kofleriaceae bacterium]|nr:plastocyanin/azurin family copper-binding protein [Kofleriaceae bacterium]
MRTPHGSRLALTLASGLGLSMMPSATPSAHAQPRARPAPITRADLDRIDKKIDEQQRKLDRLIKLQIQYLQLLAAMTDGSAPPVVAPEPRPEPRPPEPKPDAPPRPAEARPTVAAAAAPAAAPRKPKPESVGNVVGKVTGADDAVIYVDDIVVPTRGTATMKQEGKQFLPPVLIVQKGTTVQFPNLDAFFHNVFSVTPDSSFDLGSYRQGETKGVTMSKPGVVNVYCNMHPQMVGHILVVPNGNYVHAGKDGFFRLSNVPAGHHRIVAWAPDAKPVTAEADVTDTEAATVELELKKGRSGPHLKKDGLPYGSYDR